MVSVTMPAEPSPPAYNPETGIVIFPVGSAHPRMLEQINAYYEANFRVGQMKTFAQFVIEKGCGALSPRQVKNARGELVNETWQACGRRLFGDRFIAVMQRALAEYLAVHGSPPPQAQESLPEPPAHILEEIPEPDF